MENLPATGVRHWGSHAGGNIAQDLPVFLTLSGGLDRLADLLHPPFGVGEGAVLFRKTSRRQDHVGQLSGFGQEYVLDHQEVEVLDGGLGMVQIGVRHQRVFPDDV